MGFTKFAALEVLSAHLVPMQGPETTRIIKDSHRHDFNYAPRPGFLYVRSRAISSRTNDNFDTFPADEIKLAWRTFIGKPVFVNHHNEDHRKMRGVIIDAALHEDTNPDGTPDVWTEVLMEVDAVKYPKLAKAILAKKIERTSMGTDVKFSVCSACGNKASNPLEYCSHIPRLKGQWIERRTASGSKQRVLIHEICHGLGFFENSLLVEPPADPTAYVLGVDGAGVTASQKIAERIAPPAVVEAAEQIVRDAVSYLPLNLGLACGHAVKYLSSLRTMNTDHNPKVGDSWNCEDHGPTTVTSVDGPTDYQGLGWDQFGDSRAASLEALASLQKIAMPSDPTPLTRGIPKRPKFADPGQHPAFQQLQVSPDNVYDHWKQGTPEEHAQGMRWYEDANHMANLMGAGDSDKTAGIMSAYSPQASWPQNMLNAARTIRLGRAVGPGEGAMGMHQKAAQRILNGEHWSQVLTAPKTYAFAHLISTGGKDPQTGATLPDVVVDRHALSVAAGRRVTDDPADERAMSNALGNPYYYDHVAKTYRDAAARISAEEGHEIAPHQVQAATWLTRQRLNAAEMNALSPNDAKLLKGRETTQRNYQTKWRDEGEQQWPGAFDENMHAACLESYAALEALAKDEYRNDGGWANRKFEKHPYYKDTPFSQYPSFHVDDTPDDAWEDGWMDGWEDQPPFSVRYPNEEGVDSYERGLEEGRRKSVSALQSLGYGEIKAPPEVDTLRPESCPICGEQPFGGDECEVCGYKVPPKQFQDPDLDAAQESDLRKDREDEDTAVDQLGSDGVPEQPDGLALSGVEGR